VRHSGGKVGNNRVTQFRCFRADIPGKQLLKPLDELPRLVKKDAYTRLSVAVCCSFFTVFLADLTFASQLSGGSDALRPTTERLQKDRSLHKSL